MSCELVLPLPTEASVDDAALRLYHLLRRRGSAQPSDIAAEAELPPSLAAQGWQRLKQLALLREDAYSEDIATLAPGVALADLLGRRRAALHTQAAEMEQLGQAIEALTGRYQRVADEDAAVAHVEIVRGDRDHRQRLLFDTNVRTTWRSDSMHPGPLPPADVLDISLAEDAALIGRGVRVRALYGQAAANTLKNRKYLADLQATGAEVRLAPHLPFDMLLADQDVAYLMSSTSSTGQSMVEVRGEVLITSYHALYDHCWLRATPFQPDRGKDNASVDQLSEIQHEILRLMYQDVSDEQIALRLRVSTRTLRRNIAGIMETLDVTSRFHAGALAVERGLLNPASEGTAHNN